MTWPQLLSSIRAAPDDDAPRRVAIDWLQDRGDPRGEFLALTEERERHLWSSPEAKAIDERLRAFKSRPWEDAMRALGVRPPLHWRRGWLDSAAFEGDRARNFWRLMELEPVTEASFWNIDTPVCEDLAVDPALAELHSIGVRAHRDASLTELLGSPLLRDVRRLTLSPFGAEEAEALISSPARPEALDLTLIDAQAPAVIAPAEVLSRVRDLRLDYRNCDEALSVLARGKLGPLRQLGASGSLAKSLTLLGDRLDPLEWFGTTNVDDATLAPLLERPLPHLRGAGLSRVRWSAPVLARFGRLVEQLETLVLFDCSLPAETVAMLERHLSPRLRSLSLDLKGTPVTSLINSPALHGLRQLTLFDADYDRALINALNRLGRRGALRALTLRGISNELGIALDLPGVEVNIAVPPH